jgi:hypothetical protein
MKQPRSRHVWVTATTVWREHPVPGLLLGWRETKTGWEGWVILVEDGNLAHEDGPYVRQLWLPASGIRPLDPGSPR